MTTRFKISISSEDRRNNDRIYIPLSPNQIKDLKEKLILIQTPEESFSSGPNLINLLHEALKEWEKPRVYAQPLPGALPHIPRYPAASLCGFPR